MSSLPQKVGKLAQFVTKAIGRVRRRGAWDTFRYAQYLAGEKWREWKLGIDTTGSVEWHELGDDQACHDYEAINYQCLDVAFRYLHIEPERDVLLDYGSGKGRVVAVAATYPFRRVIGVERSPELCEIARGNLQRARRRFACRDVSIVAADAAGYPLPPEVTVIFHFNPFGGEVLQQVQRQIHNSLAQHPRTLTLFSVYPTRKGDPFTRCAWLTRECELSTGFWDEVELVVYRNRDCGPETEPVQICTEALQP